MWQRFRKYIAYKWRNKPFTGHVYRVDYLTERGFTIPLFRKVDQHGYVQLTESEEKEFWTLFKDSK